jgi:hypothetical protein
LVPPLRLNLSDYNEGIFLLYKKVVGRVGGKFWMLMATEGRIGDRAFYKPTGIESFRTRCAGGLICTTQLHKQTLCSHTESTSDFAAFGSLKKGFGVET